MIELRQFRQFIAVAEELSFRRAAELAAQRRLQARKSLASLRTPPSREMASRRLFASLSVRYIRPEIEN